MSKEIIITGGTGLIGKHLTRLLKSKGYSVTIFSRNAISAKQSVPEADDFVSWDYRIPEGWKSRIDGSYGIVNLAGASIAGQKWTDAFKQEMMDSRVISTKNISDAINNSANPPKVFFSASALGYYGDQGDQLITESSSSGNDLLSEICKNWEQMAFLAETKTRVVTGRIGVVLDKSEGAIPKMLTPYRLFAGGPLGKGTQWYPWIHIDDVAGLILWSIENDSVSGPINVVGPNPVRMNDFAKALGSVLRRPSIMRVPEFVLKLMLGEMAQIILQGQRAIPEKPLKSGYQFKYIDLIKALESLNL